MTWIPTEFEIEEDLEDLDATPSLQQEKTPVDILYFHPRTGEAVWVSGYQLFDPSLEIGSRKGFMRIKTKGLQEARMQNRIAVNAPDRGLFRPTFVPKEYVRPHEEGTPLFQEAFGKVNSSVTISVSIESEKEDLRLGAEAFQEEVQEVQE